MINSSQRSSGTELPLSSPHPLHEPPRQPFCNPPSKVVRFRRSCWVFLLSTCILVNGVLSPAMTGLISHILAVTHDQVPKYGGDFRRGSSYFVAVTGALGVVDACLLFLSTLFGDNLPLRWNWSGKKKHQAWNIPVHRIAIIVALAAVLRGAAAAVYANYEWWDSDQSIEQHLGNNGTYFTPETWICTGAVNSTIIDGEHPEYRWMCREAQGARYLTILITVISAATLLLVIWRWRRSNLDKNEDYQPVGAGAAGNNALRQDRLSVAERAQGNEQEMRHIRLNSTSSISPQEVVGREVYEMPAEPIHEMEHRPVIRDSDELSIQGEPTEYFARDHGQNHRVRQGSYDSP